MFLEIITAAGSLGTCVGVGCAWYQLREQARQSTTAFEDELAREYRQVAADLPVRSMLGDRLSDEELNNEELLTAFMRYFDLSNSQVFLRKKRRISAETWAEWEEGIRDNLKQPAFAAAWRIVEDRRQDCFADMRKLLADDGPSDPADW
jgi:hypothetical protein